MQLRNEKLTLFFERIKSVTFWQRIFTWNTLRSLSYEAYEEFRSLVGSIGRFSDELDQSKNSLSLLEQENDRLRSDNDTLARNLENLEEKLSESKTEISDMKASIATKEEIIKSAERKATEQNNEAFMLKQRVDQLLEELSEVKQENSAFKESENSRKNEHQGRIDVLTREIERVGNERNKEREDQQRVEIETLESKRETWARHQENVKSAMKLICQKHTIEYVDNVPFKGSPDNTLRICEEFVVFDAKSPASDDLQNFPTYVKHQAESVRKYIKEDNVRKDIFLVIPSNTVDVIQQYSFNMADYNVYVVTLDVLEPLILSLKKIEDYEFVNQLGPEERENICRVIGKFAHMTKRRIQIDHFFAWEFLDILTKCKADLPKEILEKVIDFEKSEKLNPPQERRAKQILTKDLESDNDKIQREAEAKEIVFPPSLQRDLRSLPLFEGDETK